MKKKILIIDDDKHVRYSFILILGNQGYFINAVESGEKGIEELSNNDDYDLILLDPPFFKHEDNNWQDHSENLDTPKHWCIGAEKQFIYVLPFKLLHLVCWNQIFIDIEVQIYKR